MSHSFWNNLSLVRKSYSQSIESVCREWSLTRAELDVLLFLADHPQQDRASDIVELRGLTKSHVSIAVKQLCDRGFLESKRDAKDHRVSHLVVLPAANAVVEAGRQNHREYIAKLFAGFTSKELDTFLLLQEKLVDNMRSLTRND